MTPELIGRDHPVHTLRAQVIRATESHGGLALVTGEAGIGKTSLVSDAVEVARRQGALVLSGSCWDSESAPGYWPWTQVVRALRRSADPPEWAAAEAAAGGRLSVLLGESPTNEKVESFQLYDAVTTALVTVSQRRPVLVVLEDLHWADAASLKLLEFAAQHSWFERLLLVGTYRDVEVESPGHPLQSLLLPLLAKATTVTLTGLSRAETAALMLRTAGREPAPDLVTEVHRRTGGNPFFVEQTARLWHSGSSVTAIAPGVRDALGRWLKLLPQPVVELLGIAAVLGREFHRQVLAAVAAAPVPQVDRLLERAVTGRLVTVLGDGRFSFAHDLVRETLVDALDEVVARQQHAAVVHALDRSPALRSHLLPAELARHATVAGSELEPSRVLDLLLAAAEDASGRLATEEALGHFRRAFALAARDLPQRLVLVGLRFGSVLVANGGSDEARQIFAEVIVQANGLDDPQLLARVALTLHWLGPDSRRRPEVGALLTRAHQALVRDSEIAKAPSAPAALAVPKAPDTPAEFDLPAAFRALNWSGTPANCTGARGVPGDAVAERNDRLARELSFRVTERARQTRDDEMLIFGLWAQHDALQDSRNAAARVELTEELMRAGQRAEDHETQYLAASFQWVARLERGDPRYLDLYHTFVALAERADQLFPIFASHIDRCVIATLRGRFDEAETQLDQAVNSFRDHKHVYLFIMSAHLRWAIRSLRGTFDDPDELHRSLSEAGHPDPDLLAGITAVRIGDLDGALRRLSDAVPTTEAPAGSLGPLRLRFQAEAAAASGDPALCERARVALAPFAEQWAVSLYGCDVSGPMRLWLAVLDAAQHRWDQAIDGFTAAWESAERLGARPWSVEARERLAQALTARGSWGDVETADELWAQVEREAAELGMHRSAERAQLARSGAVPTGAAAVVSRRQPTLAGLALTGPPSARTQTVQTVQTVQTTQSHQAPQTVPAAEALQPAGQQGARAGFRFDGEVWSLSFGGRTVPMPDAKGLRDLHLLLSSPHTDVPAIRLLSPDGGAVVVAARSLGGDPVLDDEAKRRYRLRLDGLDEEIDRAAARGDAERAAECERERAALLAELRAAAGLGGRSRRLGDEAERARKTVTARIRDTLRRLDRRHPELAAHLRATVSTGANCRYAPHQPTSWDL